MAFDLKPPIQIWKFADAPRELREATLQPALTEEAGEGYWLVLIPAHYRKGPEMVDFIEEWPYELPDGSLLLIGER